MKRSVLKFDWFEFSISLNNLQIETEAVSPLAELTGASAKTRYQHVMKDFLLSFSNR